MMKVEVQFFSRLKDAAGCAECEMEMEEGARVADLLTALYRKFPELAAWDAHIRVAVDLEYVSREQILTEGCRVAVMPPVQGG